LAFNSFASAKGALYAAVTKPSDKPKPEVKPQAQGEFNPRAEDLYRAFKMGGGYSYKGRRYTIPEMLVAQEYIRGAVRAMPTKRDPMYPERPDWAWLVRVDELSMAEAILAYMSYFHRDRHVEITDIRQRGNPDSGRFTYTIGPVGYIS